MIYWEDIEIGKINRFGKYPVTRDEVIDFAGKYDPQPFHLDDEAAAKTHFGRLSASGWHTAAMTMRMMVDNMKENQQAGLGSPGLDKLSWKKPVYPGDTLRCESEVLSKRRSKNRPEMGIFKGVTRVYNQHDELVMEMESNGLIMVRDPSAPMQ
ncbi:MAG: MaoC family dehydratase [Sphingomonadales bacterium]|nr:MaoC family dehydratase [Sphingomonadales bacterium]